MAARNSKGKKPARKTTPAASRSAKKVKRPAAKTSARREEATDVVYTDIRRSMHGAILRHLR